MKFFQSYRSLELNLTHKSPLTKIRKFHINSIKSMCCSFQRSICWVLLWKQRRYFQVYASRLSKYFVTDWSQKTDRCYHGIMNLEETHKAFRSSALPKLWNYISIFCQSQLNFPHHSKGSHDISIVHETIVEGSLLLYSQLVVAEEEAVLLSLSQTRSQDRHEAVGKLWNLCFSWEFMVPVHSPLHRMTCSTLLNV